MSKLNKIKNGEYIGGDKYIITPEPGGKSRVVFTPDSVITEPTPVGAEILNEIQMNGAYTLNTNRIIDGQKEVYVATLEGFTEFNNPDLNLILKINSNNSSNNVYLRLNNIDYQILNCGIGNLISGRFINARKEGNFIKLLLLEKTDLVENDTNKNFSAKGAFDLKSWLVENYTTLMNNIRENLTNMINTKTPHGGYNKSSQDLKNDIDTKIGIQSISDYTLEQIKNLLTGVYKCSNCKIGTYDNDEIYPYGTLQVYRSGSIILQIYTTFYSFSKNKIYGTFMRRSDDSGALGNFYKIYDSAQKPTPSDIGAVSKAGDTMTENLNFLGDDKYITFNDDNKIGKKSGQGISIFFNVSDFMTFDSADGVVLKLDKEGALYKSDGTKYITETFSTSGNVINFSVDGTFLNFMGCTFGKKIGTGMSMKFSERAQNFQIEDRYGNKVLDISEDGSILKYYNSGTGSYPYLDTKNISSHFGKATDTIWSGSLSAGNFSLSKSYDQYDAICFVGGENVPGRRYSNIVPISEFDTGGIIEILGLPSYSSGSTGNSSCWRGKFSSDKKTFVTQDETGTILAVYGIKYGV